MGHLLVSGPGRDPSAGVGHALALVAIGIVAVSCGPDAPAPSELAQSKALLGRGISERSAGKDAWRDTMEELVALGDGLENTDAMAQVANRIVFAQDLLAQDQMARGDFDAAYRRMRQAESLPANNGYQAVVWSQQAKALLRMGLPRLAADPIGKAMDWAGPALLVAEQDHAQGKALEKGRPNWGAILNTYLRHAHQRMGEGQFRAAAIGLESFAASSVWQGLEDVQRRLPMDRAAVYAVMGACWAADSELNPASASKAVAAFEQALAQPAMFPADRVTAYGRLAHLALREEDLDLASEHLVKLETAIQADRPDRSELCWVSTLRARHAELSEAPDPNSQYAELSARFLAFLEERRAVEHAGGVSFYRYLRTRHFLEMLIAQARSPEAALQWVLEAQSLGSYWQALGRPMPSLEQVVATFTGPESGFLVYAPGRDRTYVIVGGAQGTEVHRLAPAPQMLYRKIHEFSATLRREPPRERTDPKLDRQATELATWLLPAAVQAHLANWKTVHLVGRDWLRGVPLEALPLADGTPIGCSHALVDVPGLASGWALSQRPSRPATGPGWVIGTPKLAEKVHSRWPGLPDLSVHQDDLSQLSNVPGTQWIQGPNASIDALFQVELSEASWLQVIAHGVLDTELDPRPVILLAPGDGHTLGYLTAELATRTAAPEQVLLGACRSGLGSPRIGDAGMEHLGGAFVLAGANCVALPAARVQLSSALTIAAVWAKNLDEGRSGPEALRRARQIMREQAPHPHHWAWWRAFGVGR